MKLFSAKKYTNVLPRTMTINLSFALGAYRGTFDIHQPSYASALVALGGKVVYSLVHAAAFTRSGLSRHHQDMVIFHG